MMIFAWIGSLIVSLFVIAAFVQSIGTTPERRDDGARRGQRNAAVRKLKQDRADFWFGIANRLVWASILVCFSLVGALVTLGTVAS